MKDITRRVFIVRHGETEHNIKGVVQGKELNPPLDKKGFETSHYLGRFFPNVDAILTSPSLRAIQTAEIISDYNGAKIVPLKGLEETDAGILSGKTLKEFEEIVLNPPYTFKDSLTDEVIVCNTGKEVLKYVFSNDERYSNSKTPGGEKKSEVKKRASDAIKNFMDENKNVKNVLVVTHSGVVKYLVMGNERFKNFTTIKHGQVIEAKYKTPNVILTKLTKIIGR